MQPQDFQLLADLLKKRSGLLLTVEKQYLIESRLIPIARAHGLADIAHLCNAVRGAASEALLADITEAMTTNESSFFRDIKPYEALRTIVFPEVAKKQAARKKMRIWNAACATGQEPYSVAICIEEERAKMPGFTFEIVATDIAAKVIDKAKEGVYSQFEAQRGLPIQMLLKYFMPLPDTSWQIKEYLRHMVAFETHNLLEDYGRLGKFHIVFCRNALIYFDNEARAKILQKLAKAIEPGGFLILGATETITDKKHFVTMENFRGAYRVK